MQIELDPELDPDNMDTEEAGAEQDMSDEVMKLEHDMNEDKLDDAFFPDVDADEREAQKLEGVTADQIAEAKASELRQLRNRSTFELREGRDVNPNTKLVGTKWVLVNKGTAAAPKVKARLVCQEFATYKDADLFSGTPGLAAVKLILADLACDCDGRHLMLMDVTGAFLYGSVDRDVAIRLPAEAGAGPGVVGVLTKSLYGLRDAP